MLCKHFALPKFRLPLTFASLALLSICTLNPTSAFAKPEAEQADAAEDQAIPEGDAEKLVEFIQKTSRSRPESTDPEDRKAFAEALSHKLLEASEALLKAKPDEQQEAFAYQVSLLSLDRLADLGDKAAPKQLEKQVAAAKASKNPGVASLGWQFSMVKQLEQWTTLNKAQKTAFIEGTLAEMKRGGFQPIHAELVGLVSQALEQIEPSYAAMMLEKAIPLMEKSKVAAVRQAAERHRGTMRRLNLPGNQMKITGTLLSGDKVDWDSYRGKVVLVDFWATWCGPCRQEVPNILAMYKAYHAKGFDVLGVSLDESADEAIEYKKKMELPWDSLFAKNADERGFDAPLARYYGISGIPTAILVDRDGKVVHMNARGKNLREELQQLLGDPIKPAAKKEKATAKDS